MIRMKLTQNIRIDPLLPLEKPPMLMMTFGSPRKLGTMPLLKVVVAQSFPQPTSKEACCSHKLLEHLALQQ